MLLWIMETYNGFDGEHYKTSVVFKVIFISKNKQLPAIFQISSLFRWLEQDYNLGQFYDSTCIVRFEKQM